MNNETHQRVYDAVHALQALGLGARDEDNWQLTDPETAREAGQEWYAKWLEKTLRRFENACNSQHRSTAKRLVQDLQDLTDLNFVDEYTALQEVWGENLFDY